MPFSSSFSITHSFMFRIIIYQSFAFCLVLGRNRNNRDVPIPMVPKKDIILLRCCLGLQSNQISNRLKSCIYQFYPCVNLTTIFQNTCRIKSFSPYTDRLNRSQKSKVIYKACFWDCNGFYTGKTKRRLHDRKTENFQSLTKNDHSSAIVHHITTTGHNIKWDHFAPGLPNYYL